MNNRCIYYRYMTDLTKKHFDSKLGQIGKRLDQTATKVDLESLATKKDLGELAGMVSRGFEEVKEQLDVRKQVKDLNQRMHRIEQALNL